MSRYSKWKTGRALDELGGQAESVFPALSQAAYQTPGGLAKDESLYSGGKRPPPGEAATSQEAPTPPPGWWNSLNVFGQLSRSPDTGDFLNPLEFEQVLMDSDRPLTSYGFHERDVPDAAGLHDWIRSYGDWYRGYATPMMDRGYTAAEMDLWNPSYAPRAGPEPSPGGRMGLGGKDKVAPTAGGGADDSGLADVLSQLADTLAASQADVASMGEKYDALLGEFEANQASQAEMMPLLMALMSNQGGDQEPFGGTAGVYYPSNPWS